jgi:hypothetical protein
MERVSIKPVVLQTNGGHEVVISKVDVTHPYLFIGEYIATGRAGRREARWNFAGLSDGPRHVLDINPREPEFARLLEHAMQLGWK